jgi:hypothetical protein
LLSSTLLRSVAYQTFQACINWNSGPVQPVRVRNYPGAEDSSSHHPSSASLRQKLVRCPYFSLQYRCYREPFTCGGSGALQVLLVLHGRGRLWTGEGVGQLSVGDTLLLPAALDALACHPEGDLGMLLSTLPMQSEID